MTDQIAELRVSNDAINDSEELRRRIREEGYLFFHKLQNPDKLWDLRRQMLNRMTPWLVEGTDPIDGIADISKQCTEGDPEYTDVYHEVYKLEAFHRIAHEPEVINLLEKVMDGPVFPHPHKVARLWFPKYTAHTTPIHQDFVHFQGNFDTYTCWAPVGDCPIELGGLAVLPGSHKINAVMNHHFSLGAGGLCIHTDELEGQWHSTDYEIGDTLIFPALTVHQALPNLTEDRLRVSLDNRYQKLGDTLSEHMLEPHLNIFNNLTWENVYKDWENNDLKYYWKNQNNRVIPRDLSYSEKGFAEALKLAKAGDERAYIAMNRAILRDPNSPQAQAARKALALA